MELVVGGKSSERTGAKKKIAVVYAVGPIITGKSVSDLFGERTVGSTTMVAALRKAEEDSKVLAIVLRVDSPGGSAVASDLIWRETVRIKKPVIVSMGNVAGSGGYYISMGADKIFAEPDTITGSIGVVGGKLVVGGLYEKIGLSTEVISRGKNSGAFSSTKRFTAEERASWLAVMKDIYRQFVAKAAQGRKMSPKKLEKLAQGRIYTGRMAVAAGLVDELGTLQDAVAAAKKAAGLKADEKVDLMILPERKSIFDQLFEQSSISTSLKSNAPGVIELLSQAEMLRRVFAEPVVFVMPYRVQIK